MLIVDYKSGNDLSKVQIHANGEPMEGEWNNFVFFKEAENYLKYRLTTFTNITYSIVETEDSVKVTHYKLVKE